MYERPPNQVTAELARSSATPRIVGLTICLPILISVALTFVSKAIWSGFSDPDESAHFLNAYFISDYVRHGLGTNPLAFAQDFYIHYPKLSIGHWPPAYYATIGLLFLLLPANPSTAMVISVVVSSLPALFTALLTNRYVGFSAAIAASVWYITLPTVVHENMFFHIDQALTVAILAAASAWTVFSQRPSIALASATGALISFAVLVKGNGLSLLIFVPLHVLLSGRLYMARNWRTYLIAIFTALAIGPWYAVTAGITAEGANYQAGPVYAFLALSSNLAVIRENVGVVGIGLAIVGGAGAFLRRRSDPTLWDWGAACIAIIGSTLLLHSLLPIALAGRYMAPIFPALLFLSVLGLSILGSTHLAQFDFKIRWIIVGLLALLLAAPNVSAIANLRPKPDFRTTDAVDVLELPLAPNMPSILLVDGDSGDEGAVVALVALKDRYRQHYIVRASQLLSSSDFMGRKYRLKVNSPGEALNALPRLGVSTVIMVQRDNEPAFPHSSLLYEGLMDRSSGYRLVKALPAQDAYGTTYVFAAEHPSTPDLRLLQELNFPLKAQAFSTGR